MMKDRAAIIKVEFEGFEWDLSNAIKVQKHKVTLVLPRTTEKFL